MIMAEIKKLGQVYQIGLPNFTDLQAAYELALSIATNNDNYVDDHVVIDLGTSKEYEHIRIYRDKEEASVQVEPPGPVEALRKHIEDQKEKEYVKGFYDKISYLGQTLEVKGVKAQADGVGFVLLYEINQQPAHLTISGDGLKKLTYHEGQVLGWKDPQAIVAPGDLYSEEEAIEYVQDYVADLLKAAAELRDSKGKTAAAFVGFTKDE